MKTQYYIVIGFFLTFVSCQTIENRNEELLIVGAIDTVNVISQLEIKEITSLMGLSNEKIDNLSDHIDTLELTYYFGFCDCQRWIVSKIHKRALSEQSNLDELDPRGQVEFDIGTHGYYIEAAHKELKIDWRTEVNGTTIRFIGREYKNNRLPKDGEFTVPDPPKGKVFRYYSYEILHPYKVWGPHKLIEIDKETRDSIKEPTILTVK
jgi:hypothetical protein